MDVTSKESFNGFMIEKFMKFIIERSNKDGSIKEEKIPNYKKYIILKEDLSNSKLYFIKEKDKMYSKKLIYQLHGGSYLTPHTNMYFKNALRYLKACDDIIVASLDYRIAPKNYFPSALEDAVEGWKYLLRQGYKKEDIIVVGDSAGGNLALALIMYLRDNFKESPAGLILMSPWADLTDSGDSRIYNLHKDPMFGYSKYLKKVMAPSKEYVSFENLKNKLVSPVYGEFNDFPPMLIQVGTHEILESDAITVYEKALKKKIDAKLSRYHNMFHGFQFVGSILPEYKLAWHEVKEFINKIFKF